MIRFVIFDIGGVIVRWDDRWLIGEFSRKFGVDKRKVQKAFFRDIKASWKGEISEIEFLRRLGKDTRIKSSPRALQLVWKDIFRKRSSMNEEVFSTITALKKSGYTIALVSNTSGNYRAHTYAKRLKKYIKLAVMSCDVKMVKPEKKIFLYTLKKLRAKPIECVFIDDRRENSVAARKMGMRAIHFKSAAQTRKALRRMGVKV